MAPIVADTTPINYLVLIEAIALLPRLYGRVLIPPAVHTELSDPLAPEAVRAWATELPHWLEIVALREPVGASLMHLDPGEREAIALANEQRAAFLLLDERDGVAAASALDLRVVGTLGILDAAAAREWIDLADMFGRLRRTTFRSPHRLMAAMLAYDAQRKTQRRKE